jgi:hypothetical protein
MRECFKPRAEFIWIKGRQGGLSEAVITAGLWWCSTQPHSHVLHSLNDEKQMQDFSRLKLSPIFNETPELNRLLRGDIEKKKPKSKKVKSAESLAFKQFTNNSSYILTYLKTEKQSKTQSFVSINADIIFIDEYAKAPQDAIPVLTSCADASSIQIEGRFGTPTLQWNDFHNEYLDSTQRNWFIICDGCGHHQILIDFMDWETWRKNIFDDDQGNPYFGCEECKVELNRKHGYWKELNPDGFMRGYYFPQLIFPWKSAKKLISDYNKLKRSNLKDFIREKLGIPYSGDDVPLRIEWLRDSLDPQRSYPENYRVNIPDIMDDITFFGHDWGKPKSYSGYGQSYNDGLSILDMYIIDEMDLNVQTVMIKRILDKFDSFMAVLDQGYGTAQNQRLMKKFPGRVWACDYKLRSASKMIEWASAHGKGSSEVSWIVSINHQGIIEEVCSLVKQGFFSFPGRTPQDVAKSEAIFKIMMQLEMEVDIKRQGNEVKYKTTKAHYFMVLLYMYLAHLRGGSGGSADTHPTTDELEDIDRFAATSDISDVYGPGDVWNKRSNSKVW